MRFILLFLSLLLTIALPAQAGSVAGTGGGLETTQYLNYGELFNQTNQSMLQLQTQMSQLTNMQRQVAAGGTLNWTAAKQIIASVSSTVRQSQAVGYNSQVMASRWNTLYPDFNTSSNTNYSQQYSSWSKEVNTANKAALSVSGQQAENFSTDANTRATLESMSNDANSSQSQIAAVNATNNIALGTYDEMQKLRQLQMAQNVAQTTYMAKQNSESDKKEEDALIAAAMFNAPECAQFNKDGTHKIAGGCTRQQWADWHKTH